MLRFRLPLMTCAHSFSRPRTFLCYSYKVYSTAAVNYALLWYCTRLFCKAHAWNSGIDEMLKNGRRKCLNKISGAYWALIETVCQKPNL